MGSFSEYFTFKLGLCVMCKYKYGGKFEDQITKKSLKPDIVSGGIFTNTGKRHVFQNNHAGHTRKALAEG